MAIQETQKFCKNCNKNVLARRPGTNHVLQLLLCIFTAGLWIPVWFLHSIRIGGWKCTQCGGKV
jgi:hypothetical protein